MEVVDYLKIVESTSCVDSNSSFAFKSLKRILGSEEDLARIKEMADCFCIDVSKGYEGITLIVPLSKVDSFLNSDTTIFNWCYDRLAGCLVANLKRGVHEYMCGNLYNLYLGQDLEVGHAAEKFIDDGLGWFKSTASLGRMLIGERTKMNTRESVAFKSIDRYAF